MVKLKTYRRDYHKDISGSGVVKARNMKEANKKFENGEFEDDDNNTTWDWDSDTYEEE